jgi:hypothetical protein
MPAQFTVQAADLKVLLKELREIDPNLRKTMQKEMRDGIKPFANTLKGKVPKQSPLSGFATASAQGTRYSWGPVNATVVTPFGKRAKKPGFYPVVSMRFRTRGKNAAGFEIMELAGSKTQGRSPQGRAMIAALARVAPIRGGLGRFVIPDGKAEAQKAMQIARQIIEKYVARVNRRIK